MKFNDYGYPYVKAWGLTILGSNPDYVQRECLRAKEAGAPADAIHEKSGVAGAHTGVWVTTDAIASGDTRRRLGLPDTPRSLGLAFMRELQHLKEKLSAANNVLRAWDDAEEENPSGMYYDAMAFPGLKSEARAVADLAETIARKLV